MTDEPYAPPPARPPSPTTVRRTPWPMIIGVAVLGVLALILLLLLLTRGDGTASASATPTPSATGSASASASGSPSASAATTASASAGAPAQPDLPTDIVVATTVDNLTVRDSPGLDGERLGTLEEGALSFVAGGPIDADGFRWYLVAGLGLPPNSGCAVELETEPFNCPIWFGWAAAASEGGEPWLVEHDLACPEEPYSAETLAIGRTGLELLACFGAEPISFRGFWPEMTNGSGSGAACTAEDAPTGWLICQQLNDNIIVVDENEDMSGIGIRVSIDPATDVTLPERGTWIEVLVHLDDPAAQRCDDDATGASAEERTPEQLVLTCRAEAVLEAAQTVDGP